MSRLLFLGASVSQAPAIRYARAQGHFVVACDADPDAVAFELCDVRAVVDFSDVERVAAVAARERVDGVLAVCTDRAVVPAALVTEKLGLPGITPSVATAMTHKPSMRRCLQQGAVPQPRYVVVGHELDPVAASSITLPAVLKPADSGGQRGLFMISRLRELDKHLPETLAMSRSGEAMLEEYVDGAEVNTLFVVRGGEPTLLTISDRLRPPGAGFGVGWIHSFPAALPDETLRQIETVAAAAIRTLGLENGIAFPQLIVARDGVFVVEVAARIAAGQMADLVRHAVGIELFEIAIAQATGQRVSDEMVAPRFRRPIAIRFLTASPGLLPLGRVTAIRGLNDVRASSGVLDAGLYFDVGATIGPLQVDADRRGYVIATGANAVEALARASAAADHLRIDTSSRDESAATRGSVRPLAAVLVAVLMAATIGAFMLTEHAKLERALVASTRVDKTFSPVCGCRQRIAHIGFRLLRRTRTIVSVVNAAGRAVTTLVSARQLGPGLVRLVWDGRGNTGARLPDGRYFPDVDFPKLHRDLRLPSPIILDTARPKVIFATVSLGRRTALVRYRFAERARAALLVDGRRVVLTRFAPLSGELRWSMRFQNGAHLGSGPHKFDLLAIDAAGNRSRPDLLDARRV